MPEYDHTHERKKNYWSQSKRSSEMANLNRFDRRVMELCFSLFDTRLSRWLNIKRWCSSILYYRNPFAIASFNDCALNLLTRSRTHPFNLSLICISVAHSFSFAHSHSIHRMPRTNVRILCVVYQTSILVCEAGVRWYSMRIVRLISKCFFFLVHC